MIEDAINRLAAAIEAQNLIQVENQRLYAEMARRQIPAVAKSVPVPVPEPAPEPAPAPAPAPAPELKAERNVKKTAPVVKDRTTEQSLVGGTRPVNREDLKELAMSLSRQDAKFVPAIKAAISACGTRTITELPEDKIGIVFAELNNMAQKLAREPGEEG